MAALAVGAPAGAAIVHVNCANANLQNKINNAAPGSTLQIKGTCKGQFTVAKSLKLVGDPTATIDGNQGGRTLDITGPNVLLSHLVITGGKATGTGTVLVLGGGIRAISSNLTLRHVKVTGNKVEATGNAGEHSVAAGGGIYSDAGSLKLVDSSVTGNLAHAAAGQADVYGGGIYRNLNMSLTRSKVTGNKALGDGAGTSSLAWGGGIFDDEGHVILDSSHLDGNRARATGPAGGARGEGGGIYLQDGESLFAVGSTFNGNRANATTGGTSAVASGGGIAGFVTHGTFMKSKLTSNTVHAESTGDASASGGGAGVQNLDTLSLVSTRVARNAVDVVGPSSTSASGGGLDSPAGTLEVVRSTVDRNSVLGPSLGTVAGGGINSLSDLVVKASTISRNTGDSGLTTGGGISLSGTGTGSITNSTIALNKSRGSSARGGGIDTFVGLTVTSSTIAGNSAKIGGGLYKEVGTTSLQGTILAANTATSTGPNCEGGNIDSAGRNLIAKKAGCTFSALPSDILSTGAKLGTLGAHGGPTQTIPILASSPAVDAIPIAACQVNNDQRGVKRPQGPRCDIGAFELRP